MLLHISIRLFSRRPLLIFQWLSYSKQFTKGVFCSSPSSEELLACCDNSFSSQAEAGQRAAVALLAEDLLSCECFSMLELFFHSCKMILAQFSCRSAHFLISEMGRTFQRSGEGSAERWSCPPILILSSRCSGRVALLSDCGRLAAWGLWYSGLYFRCLQIFLRSLRMLLRHSVTQSTKGLWIWELLGFWGVHYMASLTCQNLKFIRFTQSCQIEQILTTTVFCKCSSEVPKVSGVGGCVQKPSFLKKGTSISCRQQ